MNQELEKRKASEWAREMLKTPAVILDFETTGIKDAEIVQIGLIDTAGNVLMDTLVKPNIPIPAEVVRVHGISDATVRDAPTFNDLYIQFSVLLAGKVVVAYNADFEKMILTGVCARRGLPLPRLKMWACAMRNYAGYWGQVNGRGGMKWQRLGIACQQQGVPSTNAHNALADCQMTLGLLSAMARA